MAQRVHVLVRAFLLASAALVAPATPPASAVLEERVSACSDDGCPQRTEDPTALEAHAESGGSRTRARHAGHVLLQRSGMLNVAAHSGAVGAGYSGSSLLSAAARARGESARGSVLSPPPRSATGGDLRVFMWNPHWQCFQWDHWISAYCKDGAAASLKAVLETDVDFANIVELADDAYEPPQGFGMQTQTCGWDKTSLFWNSTRWEPVGAANGGCMERWPDDRAFMIQGFRRRGGDELTVTVVGAHFPHGDLYWKPGMDTLREAVAAAGNRRVILAADTNVEWYSSTAEIMERMGVQNAASSISTDLLHTCCKNDGFSHTYDRIAANFGSAMHTQLLHDPLPDFAQTGVWQFHKGIVGTFQTSSPCAERGFIVGSVTKALCDDASDVCAAYIKKGTLNGTYVETCAGYCRAHGLRCEAQFDDYDGCARGGRYASCEDTGGSTSDHICVCVPETAVLAS